MEIIKNSINKVVLTLTENSISSNSDYLLKLTNDTTGQSAQKIIALTDTSSYYQKQRANIFTITESTNEDLTNSIVNLTPSGQWTYKAYEMNPSSPRNMDESQSIKMVESGICLVIDNEETKNNFFNNEEVKNNSVFEG